MKKFRLLLLDADVVILLFRLAIWDKVIERCDVHLAGAVLGEAHFYVDDEGERQDFDLAPYVAAGKVTRFDMLPSQLTAFLARCSPRFLEKLDAGETESLAYLLSKTDREFAICSADKIVYRILGSLGLAHRGISLEEVLREVVKQQEVLTVRLPEGDLVAIEPAPQLRPLPVLEGSIPQGWKDAVYE